MLEGEGPRAIWELTFRQCSKGAPVPPLPLCVGLPLGLPGHPMACAWAGSRSLGPQRVAPPCSPARQPAQTWVRPIPDLGAPVGDVWPALPPSPIPGRGDPRQPHTSRSPTCLLPPTWLCVLMGRGSGLGHWTPWCSCGFKRHHVPPLGCLLPFAPLYAGGSPGLPLPPSCIHILSQSSLSKFFSENPLCARPSQGAQSGHQVGTSQGWLGRCGVYLFIALNTPF